MVKDFSLIVEENQFNPASLAVFDNTPVLLEHPEHFDPKALAYLSLLADFVESLNVHEFALCNQYQVAVTINRLKKPIRAKEALISH